MDDMFGPGLEEQPVCRICFDHTPSTPFISPCNCKGSQEYVHIACLRRWQSCVLDGKLAGDSSADKAYRCGVCLSRFSLPPLRAPGWQLLSNWCRALLAVACLLLLAVSGGSQAAVGGAWQHVILLSLLLLLGARSQPIILMLMLLVLGTMGALYARGLRVMVCMQAAAGGGAWGLAVIRTGRPIDHLTSGMMLVASPQLSTTQFKESVILLLNHSSVHGAQGVQLNQPLDHLLGVSSLHMSVKSHNSMSGSNPRVLDPTSRAASSQPSQLQPDRNSHSNSQPATVLNVRSEHLWNDIAKRHQENLVFRQFIGGTVGLAPHLAAADFTTGSTSSGRLFSWFSLPRQRIDELTVLHDVPDVPGMRTFHNSGEHENLLPEIITANHDVRNAAESNSNAKEQAGIANEASSGSQRSSPSAKVTGPESQTGSNASNMAGANHDESQTQTGAAAVNALPLWVGPSPAEVLLRATQLLTSSQDNEQMKAATGANKLKILVFHGKASWAPGQLEGELRSRIWGLVPAVPEDIHSAISNNGRLWSDIINSGRVMWL